MKRVVVIGGGIIGISCALKLQADGNQVSILDPGTIGAGASKASCGYIATSEVVPLSRPDTLLKVPLWLLNPLAPLSIRPSSLPFILPWLIKFTFNATNSKLKQISQDLTALNQHALTDTQEFLKEHQLSHLLTDYPVIQVYDTHAEHKAEEEFHRLRSELGFKLEHISGQQAKELEPDLAGDFACATIFHDWRCVSDPINYVKSLYEVFIAQGGKLLPTEIAQVAMTDSSISKVTTADGQELRADEFVLAAGAASKRIAAKFGVKIMLEGILGYSTYFAKPRAQVNHGIVYAKGGFGITPYGEGLAVAGTIEFARHSAAPNWNRADILVKQARRVIPGIIDESMSGERRLGRRPFTPDTKPLLGRAKNIKNLIIASGHGQLGLAMAATTASLVKDLVANKPTKIDLTPYSPER